MSVTMFSSVMVMTYVISTCVFAEVSLEGSSNTTFLEEDTRHLTTIGVDAALDGPTIQADPPRTDLTTDQTVDANTFPSEGYSNCTAGEEDPGCQTSKASQPADRPITDGQPVLVCNDTLQNVPTPGDHQLEFSDTQENPCQNLSQSIIEVSQRPCPPGQQRDRRGRCRQVM